MIGVVALFTVACGTSSSPSKASSAVKPATDGSITVGAYDIYFDVGTINANPGALHVTLVNHGTMFHTFHVVGTQLNLEANPGQTVSGSVTLRTGSYRFECTVPGHAAAGMKGTIDVK